MTSFLPETHSEPLLNVLQRTLQRFFAAELRFFDEWKVSDRSGSSKWFNPSQYSVSIWNCTSTLNIELSTENTLGSNYEITVFKNLLDGKHDALCSNGPWLQ
jgi:hypothetical protein